MKRTESPSSWRGWITRHLPAWRRSAGYSLAETTIILSAMSVLTATAVPSIMDYVAQARSIKVSGDVQVLTGALARLLFDVSTLHAGSAGQSPDLLVGPGDVAQAAEPEAQNWTPAVDGNRVQSLVDHLVTNDVGYTPREGFGFAKGWKGPYVDYVPTDPWGHRYGVNVGVMGTNTAVVVLSAGPNGLVETPFRLGALRLGGDDVLGLLGGGR